MQGHIPYNLCNIASLRYLELENYKSIVGTIPTCIGPNLKGLTYMSLTCNNLSRTMPSSLGDLENLGYLNLSRNNLCETMPKNFINLMYLCKLFYISHNDLQRPLPVDRRLLRPQNGQPVMEKFSILQQSEKTLDYVVASPFLKWLRTKTLFVMVGIFPSDWLPG